MTTTTARRNTYAAVLAQLQSDPPAEFLAHCELMAKIGYTREKLTHTWATRRAALMHPFDDPDWEIVPLREVCTAADITYARAREIGAFDALVVPGVASNMTTRDAIAQWCEDQGIKPKQIILDRDSRLVNRAAALVRVLDDAAR